MWLRILVGAVLLSGCAIVETPPPKIVGRHAHDLSASDIEQIETIIAKGPRSTSRAATIDAVRPDRARVETTVIQSSGFEHLTFTVIKRGNTWSADSNPFRVLEHRGDIVVP